MLALFLFINFIDRGALPTAAHSIQLELTLDEGQLGILLSAFFWVYSWIQLPMGWVAERYGASRVLSAGLVMWAVVTMLMGTAHSFTTLLVLRLLLGVGESVGFPCYSKLLAETVPLHRLGTANGVVAAAYLFGPAVGTFAGGKLISAYGWRVTFVILGALPFLWLVPWSRVRLPSRAGPATGPTGAPAGVPFSSILRQRALWGTSLGLFSINYSFYLSITWLPYYLETVRGFSTGNMATVAGSAFAINALSALLAGWLIDRYIARGGTASGAYKSVMGLTCVGAMLCMMAMAWGSWATALAGMCGYQAICGISCPGCYAVPQIFAGPRASGRWVGVQNCIGNFAGVIAPWLTGAIVARTHEFTYAFVVAAAVALVGVVGWVCMLPRVAPIDWDGLEEPGPPRAAAPV